MFEAHYYVDLYVSRYNLLPGAVKLRIYLGCKLGIRSGHECVCSRRKMFKINQMFYCQSHLENFYQKLVFINCLNCKIR